MRDSGITGTEWFLLFLCALCIIGGGWFIHDCFKASQKDYSGEVTDKIFSKEKSSDSFLLFIDDIKYYTSNEIWAKVEVGDEVDYKISLNGDINKIKKVAKEEKKEEDNDEVKKDKVEVLEELLEELLEEYKTEVEAKEKELAEKVEKVNEKETDKDTSKTEEDYEKEINELKERLVELEEALK